MEERKGNRIDLGAGRVNNILFPCYEDTDQEGADPSRMCPHSQWLPQSFLQNLGTTAIGQNTHSATHRAIDGSGSVERTQSRPCTVIPPHCGDA